MTYLDTTNGADAIQDLIEKVSTGLRAARNNGMIVRMPSSMEIEFVWLVQANAFTSETTDTEPSLTTTQTATYPDVEETTVDNQNSTGSKNDSSNSSRNSSSTNKPPPLQVRTGSDGDRTRETINTYTGE